MVECAWCLVLVRRESRDIVEIWESKFEIWDFQKEFRRTQGRRNPARALSSDQNSRRRRRRSKIFHLIVIQLYGSVRIVCIPRPLFLHWLTRRCCSQGNSLLDDCSILGDFCLFICTFVYLFIHLTKWNRSAQGNKVENKQNWTALDKSEQKWTRH